MRMLPLEAVPLRTVRLIQVALVSMVILSVYLSACSHFPVKRSDPAIDLMKAKEYLERGSYDLSRALLDPYLEQDLNAETGSRVHFTLGLAWFYSVRDELERERQGIGRAMGFLSGPQVKNLNEAAGHFHPAIEANPSGTEAPEALYLLGVLHDFGYLQRFDEAMMFYRRCLDEYPGTEAARRAEERYEKLREISEGIKGTSHGE